MKNIKFDLDDITIIPAILSDINSRSEVNLEYFPVFTAPMDTLIDQYNVELFTNLNYQVCMPRGEEVSDDLKDVIFHSFGLDEIITMLDNNDKLPKKVLIDVANGHMLKLYNIAKRIKETTDTILMVGNIANPETYRKYCEIGVDYCRVGIGGGQVCTSSANTGIHFPMGSLITECYEISKEFKIPTKIIADGGFRKFSDIIKAIALGADGVMIGGILSKAIESCSDNYIKNVDMYIKVDEDKAIEHFNNGEDIYKLYRGMSTKEVQAKWGKKVLKTAEGISKYNKVEYTLSGWTENFIDYLKSNMSYCGKRTLSEYKGQVEYIFITENSRRRFDK